MGIRLAYGFFKQEIFTFHKAGCARIENLSDLHNIRFAEQKILQSKRMIKVTEKQKYKE